MKFKRIVECLHVLIISDISDVTVIPSFFKFRMYYVINCQHYSCVYGLCVYVWLSVSFCVLLYWSAVLANKRTHYSGLLLVLYYSQCLLVLF